MEQKNTMIFIGIIGALCISVMVAGDGIENRAKHNVPIQDLMNKFLARLLNFTDAFLVCKDVIESATMRVRQREIGKIIVPHVAGKGIGKIVVKRRESAKEMIKWITNALSRQPNKNPKKKKWYKKKKRTQSSNFKDVR